ncbi:MAG: hypothetical protein IKP40_11665 [Clostridia bacterium]|nr:hypothetical protein [Clostridia bacterium]
MTDREVLENYRYTGAEMELLRTHMDRLTDLSGVQCRPKTALTDDRAERLKALEACQAELDAKWQALLALQQRFEGILARIPNPVDRVLMRSYYGLGLSDEKTAESMNLSRTCVITRRHGCMDRITASERTRERRRADG